MYLRLLSAGQRDVASATELGPGLSWQPPVSVHVSLSFFSFDLPVSYDTNRSFGKDLTAPRPTRERVDRYTGIPLRPHHTPGARYSYSLLGLSHFTHIHLCMLMAEDESTWFLAWRARAPSKRCILSFLVFFSGFFSPLSRSTGSASNVKRHVSPMQGQSPQNHEQNILLDRVRAVIVGSQIVFSSGHLKWSSKMT